MRTSAPHRFPLLAAGFFGITGVGLGALGAHRLQAVLDARGMSHAWETGARYHLYHAIALLALAAFVANGTSASPGRLTWAARFWSLGILLFSGSLYGFALGGPPWLMYVTPLGGLCLLLGWAFVLAGGFTTQAPKP